MESNSGKWDDRLDLAVFRNDFGWVVEFFFFFFLREEEEEDMHEDHSLDELKSGKLSEVAVWLIFFF